MYLPDEPPYDSFKLDDLCCSECGGDVEYLIELDPEDIGVDEHTADE